MMQNVFKWRKNLCGRSLYKQKKIPGTKKKKCCLQSFTKSSETEMNYNKDGLGELNTEIMTFIQWM